MKRDKRRSALLKKIQAESHNIHRPGSAKYYRDALFNIYAVCFDYDGYNVKNARQMQDLVDEVKDMALSAFQNKKLYIKPDLEKGGK